MPPLRLPRTALLAFLIHLSTAWTVPATNRPLLADVAPPTLRASTMGLDWALETAFGSLVGPSLVAAPPCDPGAQRLLLGPQKFSLYKKLNITYTCNTKVPRAQVAVLAEAFGYASSAEPSVRDSAPQKHFLGPTERFLHEFAI